MVCTLSQGSVSVHAEISSIFAPSPSTAYSVSLFIFAVSSLVCLIFSQVSSHYFSSVLFSTRFLMLILNIALITYNGPNGLRQLTVIRHLSQTQLIKCLYRRSQESRDHVWHIISLWMPVITRLPVSWRRRFARRETSGKKETP